VAGGFNSPLQFASTALTLSRDCCIVQYQEGGEPDASILREMQVQEGNEKCQGHYHEEWQACDPGRVPIVRHEDVPNRQGVDPSKQLQALEEGGTPIYGHPALAFAMTQYGQR
jgi:hypothetical protein